MYRDIKFTLQPCDATDERQLFAKEYYNHLGSNISTLKNIDFNYSKPNQSFVYTVELSKTQDFGEGDIIDSQVFAGDKYEFNCASNDDCEYKKDYFIRVKASDRRDQNALSNTSS